METVYIDVADRNAPIGVLSINDRQLLKAGTTIYAMPVSERNRYKEYQRYSDEYDIKFIFDDCIPIVDFYAVPQVDVFAVDSQGGYIGTIGDMTDLGSGLPICYIDNKRECYLIAKTGKEFLNCAHEWRNKLIPYTLVEFFSTKEEAMEKYKFVYTEIKPV